MNSIRKLLSLLLVVAFAITCMATVSFADNNQDNVPPKLVKVNVLTPTVKAGEKIRIQLLIQEDGTGLADGTIWLASKQMQGRDYASVLPGVMELEDALYPLPGEEYISYIFEIETTTGLAGGEWFISECDLEDRKGNKVEYATGDADHPLTDWSRPLSEDSYYSPEGSGVFELTGTSLLLLPEMKSMKIRNQTVKKPGTLFVDISTTQVPGFTISEMYFEFRSKKDGSLRGSGAGNLAPSSHNNGTYSFKIPIEENFPSGEWVIGNVNGYYTLNGVQRAFMLYDDNAPNTDITAPEFTITGTGTDEISPVVNSIRIVGGKNVVKKPGFLPVEFDYTEDGSGIHNFQISIRELSKPNHEKWFAWGLGTSTYGMMAGVFKSPLKTGKYTALVPIGSKINNGEYGVYVSGVSDRANNGKYYIWHEVEGSSKVAYFSVEDEFEFDFELGIKNPSLLSKIKNLPTGKAGKILLDSKKKSNNIVKKAIFDAIAGKDKTLVFYESGYQWVVDGKKISADKTKDLDLNVSFHSVIDELAGEAVCLLFGNNGELPGVIQFRFKAAMMEEFVGNAKALHLYHVNKDSAPDTSNVNFSTDSFREEKKPNFQVILDEANAWCYVDISHNSKYLVTSKKIKQSIANATVKGIRNKTYTGKTIKQTPIVKLGSKKLTKGKDYTVAYKNNKAVGKAIVTIKGKGKYTGSKKVTFRILKANNPLKIKKAKVTCKRAKLKKAVSFKIGASKGKGKITFTLDKNAKKAGIKVNAKGKVTIPKNCKNGIYKITVKAAGNKMYKAGKKNVTIIIK